jgi:hypothetical protein
VLHNSRFIFTLRNQPENKEKKGKFPET